MLGVPQPDLHAGLAPAPRTVVARLYRPRGAALQVLKCKAPEVLLAGPAGTGKSRACLEKGNLLARKYPGSAGLILRKWKTRLPSTALKTFTKFVVADELKYGLVKWQSATDNRPAQYLYANGSTIGVGGVDDIDKIMSSEYDWIYVQEATELTEDDWQAATTRLRNGMMPYQQMLADCNPDRPNHWLNARCSQGKCVMLYGRHTDNPQLYEVAPDDLPDEQCAAFGSYFDPTTKETYDIGYVFTEKGKRYVEGVLKSLSGVKRKRLFEGVWAAAEGLVYEGWDPSVHLVQKPHQPPASWPRYWVVDFGFRNPFVCQFWAEDPDGRLYRYRELYMTDKLVEDHARAILATVTRQDGAWKEPKPLAIICDHDAEGRATLEKYLDLPTVAAKKDVIEGIQAVEARLKIQKDGKPRMMFVQNALVQRDPLLDDAKKPCCTEEEFPGYVWPNGKAAGKDRNKDEHPVKEDDHGMDCTRYMAAFKDLQGIFNIAYYPD